MTWKTKEYCLASWSTHFKSSSVDQLLEQLLDMQDTASYYFKEQDQRNYNLAYMQMQAFKEFIASKVKLREEKSCHP